ncbi:MAG: CRISPR-associated endonuclease Cas1 [Akkermansia sp.]
MNTIIIDLAYGKGNLRGECLHIEGLRAGVEQEHINRLIPLNSIEHIRLTPQTTLSGALLQELMRRGIGITLANDGGELGVFLPMGAPKGALRLAQYRRSLEPDWCLRQARCIVATKIFNQSFVLKRRQSPPDERFFRQMKQLQKATLHAADRQELMGIEGQASALYLAAWAQQLPPAYPFTGRSRRPPRDPVNACLSYLSALCAADILRALSEAGLDADLGVLHSTEDYRHNLVLDLMEPYRPALVEGVTRDLLTHGMISPHSTEIREDDGGCYLSSSGRITVIQRYEQRLNSEFTQCGQRSSLFREMRSTARQWKSALADPNLVVSHFKYSS